MVLAGPLMLLKDLPLEGVACDTGLRALHPCPELAHRSVMCRVALRSGHRARLCRDRTKGLRVE